MMRRKIAVCLLTTALLLVGCQSAAQPIEPARADVPAQTTVTRQGAVTTTTMTATQPTQTMVVPTQTTTTITTTTTAPSQPQGDMTQTVGDWIAVCNDSVNLRAEAYSGAPVIDQIKAGDSLSVLGWSERYAYVEYKGQRGYVMASYLKPKTLPSLSVVEWTDCYTYERMQQDLATLAAMYPDKITLDTIGQSENGLDIPVLRLGNPSAATQVLFQGAIHAREHMTAWLLMAMTEYWAGQDLSAYGNVCYHIIPMLNPDGVKISQSGQLPEELEAIYQYDRSVGYTSLDREEYARQWKANGKGVDLNRNFDAGWSVTSGRSAPSSERYKGEAPFSAAEAAALRDYTTSRDFDVTISYHSNGSILYYEYGDHPANTGSKALANTIKTVTGYPLIGAGGVDGAGYKDWALDVLGIPSVTIEIGCESSPLSLRESYSILERNLYVLPTVAQWAAQQ